MSQKILCTDLDGTLLKSFALFRYISRRNCKFLREWIDAGNRLVLVTSRPPEYCKKLEKEIQRPFDCISYSSAYITCDGKPIRDVAMNPKLKSDIEELRIKYKPKAFLMNAKEQPFLIYRNRSSAIMLAFYALYGFFMFKRKEDWVIDNERFMSQFTDGRVYKIMLFFGIRKKNSDIAKEINKRIRENYPDVESSWSSIVNELTPVNCNKGYGVKYYCDYLKADPKDVYVVGDSGNDISMFNAYHENSYVMYKAYPSVKKYASHVIYGVYQLRKLVLHKGEK